MNTSEIRRKFLDFFGNRAHVVKDSFSLIPHDDPTLLFTSAGMAPFKPYFLGLKTDIKRAASCQKCFRTTDIDNVGYTARHHTFFEMLGNFSFGDYFKKEAIAWAWEFVTRDMGLPVKQLHVSIHHSDDEAFQIWSKDIGVATDHIVRLGDKDNFWTIGIGPSGPCSEIYIDQGPALSCNKPTCGVGCDCARYLEFWNLVFTQYNRAEDGTLTPLEKKNIDTGMGLERLAAIMQGRTDNFDNDLFGQIIKKIEDVTGHNFRESPQVMTALKVVADHIRALSFAISDGGFPGNEGRGYVLRKILRRAARFGYRYLGKDQPFLFSLVPTVAKVMDHYQELGQNADHVAKVVKGEEERFLATLKAGSDILGDFIKSLRKEPAGSAPSGRRGPIPPIVGVESGTVLDGPKAFLLHDTYGFPLDLTREICREENIGVDEKGFNEELEKQRERGRANIVAGFNAGPAAALDIGGMEKVDFVGYETMSDSGKVLKIIEDGKQVIVITDKTPFYGTSGGQVGDKGAISKGKAVFEVTSTERHEQVVTHQGKWKGAERFREGETVQLDVDRNSRRAIMRNHTATHLLQKALRLTLGNHVKQSGSLVAPERLRFDFTHYEGISHDVLEKIESEVNAKVLDGLPVKTQSSSYDEAVKAGAMALFGEKYGDIVRMVSVGDYSRELCGGTHLSNSAEIGFFSIVSEASIASGVRRIEAITGEEALARVKSIRHELTKVAGVLECDLKQVSEKVAKVVAENHALKKDLETFKKKDIHDRVGGIRSQAKNIEGITAILNRIDGLGMDEMKDLSDELVGNNAQTLALLAGGGEKVNFVLKISKDLVKKGLNAGNLIKEIAKITGGGGGGRPDMATAGGKDINKIDEAVQAAEGIIARSLGR